jgi:hypothetical protein
MLSTVLSMARHSNLNCKYFNFTQIYLFFVCGLLVWDPNHCEAAKSSKPKPLIPIRQTIHKEGYTIDTVGDKKQKEESETIRVILRVRGKDKKLIKPKEIVLINSSGEVVEADDRDDCKTGNEENSGLPLTVSPSVNSAGGGGVGVGLNLNKLFGGGGEYSYTKIDFLRKDFVSGMKLKLILPDEKETLIPLTSIAEPAS